MIGLHLAWTAPTNRDPQVIQVFEVSFDTLRPPVALGPAVTHGIIDGRRIAFPDGAIPTLEGTTRYLVLYDDGVIARATKESVNQATARQGDGLVLL